VPGIEDFLLPGTEDFPIANHVPLAGWGKRVIVTRMDWVKFSPAFSLPAPLPGLTSLDHCRHA
jgi:hypothetical protein